MSDKPEPGPLAVYLQQLQTNPIRTKSLTAASLNAVSEYLASYIAKDKDPRTGSYFTPRIPKMALYGFFVSAPLSHYLIQWLQRTFAGKNGLGWKLAQILTSNVLLTPIQSFVFVVSMALISGARTVDQIKKALRASLPAVIKASWLTSPVVLAVAQALIPETAWVPFFSVCFFVLGTYNNAVVKKKQIAARKAAEDKEKKNE